MENPKYRRHPRVHQKQAEQNDDSSISISGACALGILVLTFAKGVFLGYIINRKMSQRG